jgi:hypothetical protein
MDRSQMIDDICNDLEDWLKRDPYDFWEHVRELERQYLNKKSDADLEEIHKITV